MATAEHLRRDEEEPNEGSHKQYGNTTIGGSANAHLGDIVNNVNISGPKHLHVQAPLSSLSTAALAVQALASSGQFLDLCQQIYRRDAVWADLTGFENLSQTFLHFLEDSDDHVRGVSTDKVYTSCCVASSFQ